jgi:hypothetical protein
MSGKISNQLQRCEKSERRIPMASNLP